MLKGGAKTTCPRCFEKKKTYGSIHYGPPSQNNVYRGCQTYTPTNKGQILDCQACHKTSEKSSFWALSLLQQFAQL